LAIVLEYLGQHVARGRYQHAVELLLEDLAHALLVGRVGVGVDEADRHRLDPVPLDQLRHLAGAVLVELLEDRAGVVDALGDLEAKAPGNRRRIDVPIGVP
jgi:hypothetical protein